MKEIRMAVVNGTEIPVLVSDDKEALLAAKAAGRAIVGLWRPREAGEDGRTVPFPPAPYVVEDLEDVTEEFLERVARRHLGLPWRICETKRLLVRELFGDDFDEVWTGQIGHGFGSVEELEAYTKRQYTFYEFGFWALVEKKSGELAGVAGLKVPEEDGNPENVLLVSADCRKKGTGQEPGTAVLGYGPDPSGGEVWGEEKEGTSGPGDSGEETVLELGYHIFPRFRRRGYALEACAGILQYGQKELGADRFLVRIRKGNTASFRLAGKLGFSAPARGNAG